MSAPVSTSLVRVGSIRSGQPSSSVAANQSRGICSITTHSGEVFRFRTNPNSIKWKYVLNTNVEDTYGGRVIQILSTRITQLQVQVEAGWGGWPYVVKVANFIRKLMDDQRNGKPATFEYTTKNWKLKVFASSIPFTDSVGRPNAKLDMAFNVVEDSSGVLSSQSIGAEIARLQDGIGYKRGKYNSQESVTDVVSNLFSEVRRDLFNITNMFSGGNPLNNIMGSFTGNASNPTSPVTSIPRVN